MRMLTAHRERILGAVKIYAPFALFFILILSGCEKSTETSKLLARKVETKDNILKIYTEKEIDNLGENAERINLDLDNMEKGRELLDSNVIGGTPAGVLCREDDIIIVNKENDCLKLFNYEGTTIKTVGSTGNGDQEFLAPNAIDYYNSKIYILDGRNFRVTVMDDEFNFLYDIKLNQYDDDPDTYTDLAVAGDNDVYVSGHSLYHSHIYRYTDDRDEPEVIGENFCGYLARFNDKVYAINTGSIYIPANANENVGLTNGKNYLFQIINNELEQVCELPYGLFINDFIIEDFKIICVSASWCNILVFDMDGKPLYSLGSTSEDRTLYDSYISKSNLGKYFVTDGYTKNVYEFDGKD